MRQAALSSPPLLVLGVVLAVVEPARAEAAAASLPAAPPPAAESPPLAAPEDTGELSGLLDEDIVSAASMATETASTAPATTWTISSDELRRHGVTTLAEAINFLALGMVTERDLDFVELGARGVLINGDYGSHVLVLIDGHAVNEPWDGAAYFDRAFALPFELIDHIEVVLGPGSVLYGSNAMLGVINVVTKDARAFAGGRLVLESELPSSIRAGVGGGGEFGLWGQRGQVVAMAEYFGAQGPAIVLGPQDYGVDAVTGTRRCFDAEGPCDGVWGGLVDRGRFQEIPSAFAHLRWGDVEARVRGALARRGVPSSTYGDFDGTGNYELDRWLAADLRYHAAPLAQLDVGARAYGDLYDYVEVLPTRAAENCLEGQLGGCVYTLSGRSAWTGLELQGRFDWFGDAAYTTMLGFDGRLRAVSSDDSYLDAMSQELVVTSAYEANEAAMGVYVEQTARPLGWLSANLGARLDLDQRFGAHLSPRAAVVVDAWQDATVKAIYAEAFRAPDAFERYYSDPTWWLASDNLGPEVVRAVELVLQQRLGAQRLLAGLFASHWQGLVREEEVTADELAAAVADGRLAPGIEYAYTYRNTASMLSYGLNLGFEGSALSRQLRYGATLTLARLQADWLDVLEPLELPVASGLFGNAHVSYLFGPSWPTLGAALRFVGPRPVDASDFEPLPVAPPQLELRFTAHGPLPLVQGLAYRISLSGAFSSESPYAVGPLSAPAEGYTRQETMPVDPLRVLAGLQYSF
jgi:outer membrane receptor protein involved in Fe transport